MGRPIKNFNKLDKRTDIELSWIAGIIEGEGWITLMHKLYTMLGVGNTDKKIMRKVSDIFEHRVTICKPNKNNNLKTNKPFYKCVLVGNKADVLFKKIKPFMVGNKKNKVY